MLNAMNLLTVTFQGASLRKTFLAKETLVRSHARMCSRMPLEVKSVVEALSTECAKITFYIAVTLHVTIKKPLKAKVFAAHAASETIGIVLLLNKQRIFLCNGCL